MIPLQIYEEGLDLSGGQWQRLAIARALFRTSKLLILDEPTAAIDPIAECDLYNVFLDAAVEKACIIISHRLGSARLADRIIVLKGGQICEQGTHEELMNAKGVYYNMYENQAAWYVKESGNE